MNGIDGALVQNEPTVRRETAFGREIQIIRPIAVQRDGIPRPVEVIPHAFGECTADLIILLYLTKRMRRPDSTESRRLLCGPVQAFGHHIPAVQNTQNQGQWQCHQLKERSGSASVLREGIRRVRTLAREGAIRANRDERAKGMCHQAKHTTFSATWGVVHQ